MNIKVKKLASVCPLDCPDTCSLSVSVTQDTVVKVRGSMVNPVTKGSVCKKVAKFYPEFVHGPHRLTSPLIRTGEKGSQLFRKATWDEALERIYQEFDQILKHKGGHGILPLNYAGPHGQLAAGSLDRRFFTKLGASDLDRAPLCGGVRSLAYRSMFGNAQGMAAQQIEFSDVIIIWGSNTSVANVHLMRTIQQARKQGAKLIVVDPRRTQVAEQADLFIQIKPGSDVLLAMSLVAYLHQNNKIDTQQLRERVTGLESFLAHADKLLTMNLQDMAGVAVQEFEDFYTLLSQAKSIALNTGVGLERTRNGGSAIRAAQSLLVFFGQIGTKGHGVLGNYGAAFPTSTKLSQPSAIQHIDHHKASVFNIVDVADHLLDRHKERSIDAVFIYNHNPIATHPDQNKMRKALMQKDIFVVGCDVQMNDSMQLADVILPASTHFEHADVYASYGHGYLQRAEPVISPVGESLPNMEIFRLLAKKFGFSDECFKDSDEQLIDQAITLNIADHGIAKVTELPVDKVLAMQSVDRLWLSEELLETPTGKIELYSQALNEEYASPVPDYKALDLEHSQGYVLLSPASDKRINATFGGRTAEKSECVEINPQDARREGLSHQEQVVLYNELGEVSLQVKITDAVAPGVLCVEKGAWCASSKTGQTVNALISSQCKTDIRGGAAYYDTFVHIKRVSLHD